MSGFDSAPSPATKRSGLNPVLTGVLGLCIVAFNLWLTADHEIAVGLSPVDELFFIRKGECTYWFDEGYSHETSFLKEAPYPLFVSACYRLGVPLRTGHELLYLAAAGALAGAMVYRQSNNLVGLVVFAATTLIPARLYILRQPLHDSIYSSVMMLVVAALLWQLKRKGEPGRWRRWLATGVAVGLLWNIRQERQLVLVLLATFFAGVATLWPRRDTRRRTVQEWLVEWAPAFVICVAITLGFMTANYVRWGVFATSEFAAPKLGAAYAALLRIKPESRILYVPITREMRERAYEVSPTFRQIKPHLEGQVWGNRAPNWLGFQNVPAGEYSGGWFVLALRDAAAAAGFCGAAGDTEAFFGKVAAELHTAEAEGKLTTRWLPPGLGWALNPDLDLYWRQVPRSWRAMWYTAWSFRLDQYPLFDPPEATPKVIELFDRVGNRRAVAPKSQGHRAECREWLADAFASYSQFVLAAGCLVGAAVLLLVRSGGVEWGAYQLPALVFGVYGFVRFFVFALFDAGSFPGNDSRYLFPATVSLTLAAVWLLADGLRLISLTLIRRQHASNPERLTFWRATWGVLLVLGSVLLVSQWAVEKSRPPDFLAQVGSVDGVDDGYMWGWARFRENPGQTVELNFFEGDKPIGSAMADESVPAVVEVFPFLRGHCFRFRVPDELRDEKEHVIRSKVVGASCILSNTPNKIAMEP